MNTSENPQKTSKDAKFIPRWLAYVLFIIVWGVVPWGISLLAPRYGWIADRPGIWNLLGMVPVAMGIFGSLWTLVMHFEQSREGLDWELDKNYLLTSSSYSYSRNPMYLSELVLLFGWIIFYGSVAVLIAFLVWWACFSFYQIPLEERVLESRFGETYLEYKNRVPRWFGKIRR